MEVTCSFCGTLGSNQPGRDHECAQTLIEAAERATRGITADAGWDSLTVDALMGVERELAAAYKGLSDLTAYFSEQIDEATRRRDGVYNRKQAVRKSLNNARAEVRRRMEDVS